MAQTAMTVRMDNQQKAQFDKLCEQFGMSANTAINIFVKAVIRSKSIPFSIQAKNEEEDEVTAKAKAAFKELRAKAERGETPELTLDEINEEIREVRRLRKRTQWYMQSLIRIFLYQPLSLTTQMLQQQEFLKVCSFIVLHLYIMMTL